MRQRKNSPALRAVYSEGCSLLVAAGHKKGTAGRSGLLVPVEGAVWDAGMQSPGMAGEAPWLRHRSRSPVLGTKAWCWWPWVTHRVLVRSPEGQPVTGDGMVPGAFLQVSLFPEVHFLCCSKSSPNSGLQQPQRCKQEGEREKEGGGQRKSHQEQGCLGRA